MNCFTPALPFLDDPYFAVGSCIPDWLSAVDRKVRTREKLALPYVEDSNPDVASLAKGVIQHHRDDDWFHQTHSFADLSMRFSLEIRDCLHGEAGFRAGLMGHIVIELLLDAYLDHLFPGKLEAFYETVAKVEPEFVQSTVNLFAKRDTENLVRYIEGFLRERYIFDYTDDDRLLFRVNRVFARVKLEPFGSELKQWLPTARQRVYENANALLAAHPCALPNTTS